MPKEMLPVVDRPLIQHVVDEARAGRHRAFHLRHRAQQGRHRGPFRPPVRARDDACASASAQATSKLLAQRPAGRRHASFTRQQEPLGLGHAVWCARELIGDEPFALLLPDVLVKHERGCLAQMIDARRASTRRQHHRGRGSADGARSHVRRGRRRRDARARCSRSPTWSRSRSARRRRRTSSSPAATSCSRRSSTFSRRRARGAGGEIQLTDAMIALAKTQAVLRAEIRRPELRLRIEDRLPRRQCRLRARAPTSRRRCVRRSSG